MTMLRIGRRTLAVAPTPAWRTHARMHSGAPALSYGDTPSTQPQSQDAPTTAFMRLIRSNAEMRQALEAVEERMRDLGQPQTPSLDFRVVAMAAAKDNELHQRMRRLSILLREFQVVQKLPRQRAGMQSSNKGDGVDGSRSWSVVDHAHQAARPLVVSQGNSTARLVQISTPPHERQMMNALTGDAVEKAAAKVLRRRIEENKRIAALSFWEYAFHRLTMMLGFKKQPR